MKTILAVPVVLALAACAGTPFSPTGTTHVQFKGAVCGQPLEATVADGKERSGFHARVRCADGSEVDIVSGESRAFEGQAQAIDLMRQILPPLLDRALTGGAAGAAR